MTVAAAHSRPKAFLAYQQRLLDAVLSDPVVIYEKSRRIGASWALAAAAVVHGAASREAGGMNVYYMGYNLEMAREFVTTCAWWAELFGEAAGEAHEVVFENPGRDINAHRIRFAGGFEITALPSSPRSLRGMQGLVLIDEAAFHDDLAEVLKAALALLMWGGKVVVVSTHDGDVNPFNTLIGDVRGGRKPYRILRTTFDDALGDGLYKRICEVQGSTWTAAGETSWRQDIVDFYGTDAGEELFCEPKAGQGTYLAGALIEARMDATAPVIRWARTTAFAELADRQRTVEAEEFCARELAPLLAQLDDGLVHVFGEDFGRLGDLTVIWPLAIGGDLVRRTPFAVELRNIPFQQQEQILFYIVDRLPRFSAGALDARGNGQYLAERAMQRYGSQLIRQVMLSQDWYLDNMPPYKAAFEDGRITLPGDADVLADHRALVMKGGIARIPEGARARGRDGQPRHGDSAIAAALAHFASRLDTPAIEFQATHEGRRMRGYDNQGSATGGTDIDLSTGFGAVRGGSHLRRF